MRKVQLSIAIHGAGEIDFWMSLVQMVLYHKAKFPDDVIHIEFALGTYRHLARTKLAKTAIKNDCTHLMFMDADMDFPKDALEKLIAHDVPVVSGLYVQSNGVPTPVIYKSSSSGEVESMHDYIDYPRDSFFPVISAGAGCLLIKTEVFPLLKRPWFGTQEGLGEDMWFARLCGHAGIQMFCDSTVKCLHALKVKIWRGEADLDAWKAQGGVAKFQDEKEQEEDD